MDGHLRTRRNNWIWLLAVALALAGCNRQTVYSHYEPIATEGWQRNDSICFVIPNIPEDGTYAQTIGLRTDNVFPYKSLTLVIETKRYEETDNHGEKVGERKETIRRDTVNIWITDDEGNILGTGINHYQYEMGLPDITLHQGDSMHVSVYHLMRRECLPGITDLGFCCRKISGFQ